MGGGGGGVEDDTCLAMEGLGGGGRLGWLGGGGAGEQVS